MLGTMLATLLFLACGAEPDPGPRQGQADPADQQDGDGGGDDTGSGTATDGGASDGGAGDGGSGDGGSGDGGSGDGGSGDGGSGDGGTEEEVEPCPSGVICVDSFPYSDSDDTSRSSLDDFDSYACASSTDESGPEVVYQVDLAEDGYLAATLSGLGSGVDLDVHILGSLDADDCYDRGHWDAGSFLPAGRYYVRAPHPDSLDSRYRLTGWISDAQIIGRAYALF